MVNNKPQEVLPCRVCKEVPSIGSVDGKPAIGHTCEWVPDAEVATAVNWWQGTIKEWNKIQTILNNIF